MTSRSDTKLRKMSYRRWRLTLDSSDDESDAPPSRAPPSPYVAYSTPDLRPEPKQEFGLDFERDPEVELEPEAEPSVVASDGGSGSMASEDAAEDDMPLVRYVTDSTRVQELLSNCNIGLSALAASMANLPGYKMFLYLHMSSWWSSHSQPISWLKKRGLKTEFTRQPGIL